MRFQEFASSLKESNLDVDPHGLPQNYFGPSQDYPVPKPLPDVPVNLPDQYRADRDILIYDGQIFNAMPARLYQGLHKILRAMSDVIPAGKISGIAGEILITQHGGINYFVTPDRIQRLRQELAVSQLADRNRSAQSRMARGERLSAMPTGKIDGTKPTAGTTDSGSVRDPKQQYDRPARRI